VLRRTFLATLPALGVALRSSIHAAALPQDLEFIRAWERAQLERPRTLASRARIATAGEPGIPMVIAGRLYERDGRSPAPDIIVFAYHTDVQGLYDVRSNGPHSWRLKGWAVTGTDGRFVFDTIRPAPYPSRREPAHVHVSFEGPRLQRRWGGLLLGDDPLVPREERDRSARAAPFGSVRPVTMRDGVQQVDYPVRITDEGVF